MELIVPPTAELIEKRDGVYDDDDVKVLEWEITTFPPHSGAQALSRAQFATRVQMRKDNPSSKPFITAIESKPERISEAVYRVEIRAHESLSQFIRDEDDKMRPDVLDLRRD